MREALHLPVDQGVMPYHRVLTAAVAETVPEGGSVLDIGCGNGILLELLASARPDLRLFGIDGDPRMVELAGAVDGVSAEVVDLDDLDPTVVGGHDAVTCCHVLEHLMRPFDVLEAIAGGLAGGGTGFLAVPNLLSPIPMLNAAARRDGANEGHLYGWDRPHFAQLLRAAGFEIDEWRTDSVQIVPGRYRESVPGWVDRVQTRVARVVPRMSESLIAVVRGAN